MKLYGSLVLIGACGGYLTGSVPGALLGGVTAINLSLNLWCRSLARNT